MKKPLPITEIPCEGSLEQGVEYIPSPSLQGTKGEEYIPSSLAHTLSNKKGGIREEYIRDVARKRDNEGAKTRIHCLINAHTPGAGVAPFTPQLTWAWLSRVPRGGACLAVVLGLATEAAMRGRLTNLKLSRGFREQQGVSRDQLRRARQKLADCGLIAVHVRGRKSRRYDLLPIDVDPIELARLDSMFSRSQYTD